MRSSENQALLQALDMQRQALAQASNHNRHAYYRDQGFARWVRGIPPHILGAPQHIASLGDVHF